MSISAFPIATRAISEDILSPETPDPVYATPATLIATTVTGRGLGAFWQVSGAQGQFLYQEQADDATDYHLETAGGTRLKVIPADGTYPVEAFGAIGDGTTDDTAAIRKALEAAPSFGMVCLSPGKTYIVSEEIDVRPKSLIFDGMGAEVKCANDSIWQVFKLGGSSASDNDYEVTVRNMVLNGNLVNQRYYPAQVEITEANFWNGDPDPAFGYTIMYTTKGRFATNDGGTTYKTWDADTPETDGAAPKHAIAARDGWRDHVGTDIGDTFYSNSTVNGETWDTDWEQGTNTNGNNAAGIDVNGGGNDGLVAIVNARVATFDNIHCKDFIRNGVATYGAREVRAHRIRGTGQLPTSFFEITSVLGIDGRECALMKFSGQSSDDIFNGEYYARQVVVTDCHSVGGAIPLFVRTNTPKPPVPGITVKVSNSFFYGYSRQVWYEVCQDVRHENCHFVPLDYPESSYRNAEAIFFGSGTQIWTIENSYCQGRIDTNNAQAVAVADIVGSVVRSFSLQPERVFQCRSVRGSIIESRAGGILVDDISDSEVYLETLDGSESFKVLKSMTNCKVGKERFEAVRDVVEIAEGASSGTLSGTPDEVVRVMYRERARDGGILNEIHVSDYDVTGTTITIESSDGTFEAGAGGGEVEVEWYANRTDTLTTTGALETEYTLTQTGGQRTRDIVSLAYNGVAVVHLSEVQNPTGTTPYWTHAMNSAGNMVITLSADVPVTDGQDLVVTYKPPLAPYRDVTFGDNARTIAPALMANTQGVKMEGGTVAISGQYEDIEAPALFQFEDGMGSIDLTDVIAERMSGAFLGGEGGAFQIGRVYARGGRIADWGLQAAKHLADGDLESGHEDKAIGANRSQGTQILRRVAFTHMTWEKTDFESGASERAGTTQSGVADYAAWAALGGNAYLGVSALSVGVDTGTGGTKITLADFA